MPPNLFGPAPLSLQGSERCLVAPPRSAQLDVLAGMPLAELLQPLPSRALHLGQESRNE